MLRIESARERHVVRCSRGPTGRPEALLHTEVNPHDIRFEPTATLGSEMRRLGDLWDAEQALTGGNCLRLAASRHRQLDVV